MNGHRVLCQNYDYYHYYFEELTHVLIFEECKCR